MYLDKKRVFLAGSTGMVGASIMNYILDHCPMTKIRAVYYDNTKPFIKHKKIEYVYGDLRLAKDCRSMTKGCDCAIMAAANTTSANTINSQPWKHVHDNMTMNLQMLEAFHSENIKRIVYIGSATLYQDFGGHIKEVWLDLNKDPDPIYFGIGWTVRFIEKLCRFWHERYGMEILIIRAANIFGPYAKFDPLTSNFIPAIIRKALDKMDPFEVWGSPRVTRDVLYSEDFARAITMLLNAYKIKFDTFNIGSGIQTTVGDIVRLALKYSVHKPLKIKYNLNKPATINFRALNCSKANRMFGWKPRYTIDRGIEKTMGWWIENKRWWKK